MREEHAPDSLWGLDRLRVHPDGRFEYENRQSGSLLRTRSGWIGEAFLEQIARELEEARFPDVPPHEKPPGGDYVAITAGETTREQLAFMHGSAAERFPGYGPLLERVRAWTTFLRTDGQAEAPPGIRLA